MNDEKVKNMTNNNNNSRLKVAGLVLTALVILSSVVGSFAVTNYKVNTLKTEGTLPARQNRESIVILETKLTNIESNTTAILEVLKKDERKDERRKN
ncbi:MAG TPA: hypothetical protein VMW25_01490 [Clostridia bacterium]|nr:hypothetical protein [Clostridia bacterium]